MMHVSHGTYQAVIALVAILGIFSLAGVSLILEGTAQVPEWASSLTSAIVAFYFGGRAVVAGAVSGTNGSGSTERERDRV